MQVISNTQKNFFEEPTVITLRGKEISISPLPVKKLSRAAVYAEPIAKLFSAGEINVVELLKHVDLVIELCALATDEESTWVGELNAGELLELAKTVVNVNQDFFFQSVMPMIQDMMKQTVKAVKVVKGNQG